MTRPGDDASLPTQLAPPAIGLAAGGPVGGALKRGFDIGVALLALVLLSPLLLITAMLIKITIGGPILLAHSRIGLNGKIFRRYKFRTMLDAEEHLSRHLTQSDHVAREWQVNALGQILRNAGIDELPQLINVLRGDMSCIGPRPATAMELQRYGTHAADYLKMRPGLIGLWQISDRERQSYTHRVELDRLYACNWSMRLDLAIIVRTAAAALKFNQAV